MSKISKPALVSIVGFVLSMGVAYTNVSKPVKNACIIGGLCLIFLGVVLSRLGSSISDNKKIVAWSKYIEFDLPIHYMDYKKVMNTKDQFKYSTWRDDLLEKYNVYDAAETDSKKKSITADIQHYLKDIRRDAAEKVELFQTILIPAEFGVVASMYELDFENLTGEYRLVAVIIVTIALCMLFAVEIHARNRVIRFVDDFCEILNIPLG